MKLISPSIDQEITEPTSTKGIKAARLCLFLPIIAIGTNILSLKGVMEGTVPLSKLIDSFVLIVTGFLSGIMALFFAFRPGGKKIMGRTLLGLAVNGCLLIMGAAHYFSLAGSNNFKSKVIGQWELNQTPEKRLAEGNIKFNFRDDGTLVIKQVIDSKSPEVVICRWFISDSNQIGIKLADGKTIGLGMIKSVDEQSMALNTTVGDEVYTRLN